MDLARGPTFPLTPPTIQYRTWKNAETERGGRVGEKTESRFRSRYRGEGRGGGIIVDRGSGGKGRRETYTSARARAEIQLRSIDRLRSRQISVRCEIRRLVSLASWSRGLLASDTFDSSNRFVTGRNLETSTTISCSRPREISKGSRESRRTKFRIDRFGVNRLPR